MGDTPFKIIKNNITLSAITDNQAFGRERKTGGSFLPQPARNRAISPNIDVVVWKGRWME